MTSPRRLSWKRGSREPYPAGAKLVTRTTRYGNPFRIIEHGGPYTRQESLRLYRLWLQGDPQTVAQAHAEKWPTHWPHGAELVELIRANLAGRDLVCTGCREDEDCHGDLVLRVARGEEP
jgi:hypothetical protein